MVAKDIFVFSRCTHNPEGFFLPLLPQKPTRRSRPRGGRPAAPTASSALCAPNSSGRRAVPLSIAQAGAPRRLPSPGAPERRHSRALPGHSRALAGRRAPPPLRPRRPSGPAASAPQRRHLAGRERKAPSRGQPGPPSRPAFLFVSISEGSAVRFPALGIPCFPAHISPPSRVPLRAARPQSGGSSSPRRSLQVLRSTNLEAGGSTGAASLHSRLSQKSVHPPQRRGLNNAPDRRWLVH